MTEQEREIWSRTFWAPDEDKVVYGTAGEYPVAYDCFDCERLHSSATYVVGDEDTGAMDVVATLLYRYATEIGVRVFIIDYAGTFPDGFLDIEANGWVTRVTQESTAEEVRSFVGSACREMGDPDQERRFVLLKPEGGDDQERMTPVATAIETVISMSEEEPETKDILLVTGIDRLLPCAPPDAKWKQALLRMLKFHGLMHRLSVWLTATRIPELRAKPVRRLRDPDQDWMMAHRDPALSDQAVFSEERHCWDLCPTKLLFAMSAEDAIRCDAAFCFSDPRFGARPVTGPVIIQAIARGSGTDRFGRFAFVVRGTQSENIVVDGL